MNTSNQAKAAANELQVLQAIGHVGWLSATQIARWAWGEQNPHSARVSADRVLKRLMAQGDVLRRNSSLRMSVYILTKAGALRANKSLTMELFRHGYDLSQLDAARQRPAVDYLITQHHQGKIAMGVAGLRKAIELGLIPQTGIKGADGIVIDHRTGEFKAVLVVRNTHPALIKKAKRIQKAVGDLELIGSTGLIRFFRNELRNQKRQ
jgi:hypothetical protein